MRSIRFAMLLALALAALGGGHASAQFGGRPGLGYGNTPPARSATTASGATATAARQAAQRRNATTNANARPTLRQRIGGAIRGAIEGFRLGNFRAQAAAAATRRVDNGGRGRGGSGTRPRMLRLPDVRQAVNFTCGPSALQAVLGYFGKGGDLDESTLAAQLETSPEHGTEPQAILRVAREHGLTATMREGMTLADLRGYVDRGIPVIVDYQAWSESPRPDYRNATNDGHYSVVVGVSNRHVYLEDPSILGARGRVPRAEFEARWHDVGRDGRRYERMGIVLESDTPPAFPVRAGRILPTE